MKLTKCMLCFYSLPLHFVIVLFVYFKLILEDENCRMELGRTLFGIERLVGGKPAHGAGRGWLLVVTEGKSAPAQLRLPPTLSS